MYDTLKTFGKRKYTGLRVGGSHNWFYKNGKWFETKEAPDKWTINFNCVKTRVNPAPVNSGAAIGTKYHWYIIADQIATKIDPNSYETEMKGIKLKVGHKRPYWRTFSYNYPNQTSYKERIIEILEKCIKELKSN